MMGVDYRILAWRGEFGASSLTLLLRNEVVGISAFSGVRECLTLALVGVEKVSRLCAVAGSGVVIQFTNRVEILQKRGENVLKSSSQLRDWRSAHLFLGR
jgi:hypothetical protein